MVDETADHFYLVPGTMQLLLAPAAEMPGYGVRLYRIMPEACHNPFHSGLD
jgi:hypothetical protein